MFAVKIKNDMSRVVSNFTLFDFKKDVENKTTVGEVFEKVLKQGGNKKKKKPLSHPLFDWFIL